MDKSYCYLDHYPLKNLYKICEHYLYNNIDWSHITSKIRKDGMIWFDISDALSLFSHLTLDENYTLVCYLSSEYHGIWGRVAAIRGDISQKPSVKVQGPWTGLFYGVQFELPEEAAAPMEAIFNDGTAEGYFEALLCGQFLSALPYTYHEQNHWDRIVTAPPFHFYSAWDSYIDIEDWRPRIVSDSSDETTLFVFRRKIEHGFGGSSGQDCIYLSQYNFQRRLLWWYRALGRNTSSMYHGHILDDARYTADRRCCVSTTSSILIAREKADV